MLRHSNTIYAAITAVFNQLEETLIEEKTLLTDTKWRAINIYTEIVMAKRSVNADYTVELKCLNDIKKL
jgi:hypothetical protein